MDLKTLQKLDLKSLLPIIYDLAYIDLSIDKKIINNPECEKLNKICQFIIQYLIYSIGKLQNNEKILDEKVEALDNEINNIKELISKQKIELEKLSNKEKILKIKLQKYKEKISKKDIKILSESFSNSKELFIFKKIIKKREFEILNSNKETIIDIDNLKKSVLNLDNESKLILKSILNN